MKNFKKLNLAVATLAVASAMAPVSVFADDDTGVREMQGNSTITFEGSNFLSLTQVPDFTFDGGKLDNLQNNKQFTATGKAFTVVNLTGNSNGYTIEATASELTSQDSAKKILPVAEFNLQADNGDASKSTIGGKITGYSPLNIYKNTQTVAKGNEDANGEISSGKTTATLKLSSENVKATTYKGTIDYTLKNGPTNN